MFHDSLLSNGSILQTKFHIFCDGLFKRVFEAFMLYELVIPLKSTYVMYLRITVRVLHEHP